MTDKLILGGHEFTSRFILGSGKYSLDLINAAVQNAGAEIITLALRRANQGGTANILDYIPEGVTLLPNTSGARTADEAVRIARLSRECGCGDFVKIEIMRDSKYLLPDNQETIRATEILAKEQQGGFVHLRARIDVDTSPDAQLMNNLSMIMMLNDPRIAVAVRGTPLSTRARTSSNRPCATIRSTRRSMMRFISSRSA